MWILGWTSVALAESWCAAPLEVHEWGVEVLRTDGAEPVGVPLPSWFHRAAPEVAADVAPVRHLPRDTGIRTLPVVQVFGPRVFGNAIPFALEVGFTEGRASVWYPQVDRLRPASEANGPAAAAAREVLLSQRAEHVHPLPSDPTRQLSWEALTLTPERPGEPAPAEQPWVQALRDIEGALWIERDRFLFYEADTTEAPALRLEAGDRGGSHLVLRNTSDWTVHDVVIVAHGLAWTAPAIPPGATAGFLLDDPLDREGVEAWLRTRWTTPRTEWRMSMDDCVMMRDPGIPVEAATDHRLYEEEVDVLLSVWADRLLADEGVRVVYREDRAAVDARMPLSVYTDMYHYAVLRRLGVVVVEGLQLP